MVRYLSPLARLLLFILSTWSAVTVAAGLSLEIFVSEPDEINVTSALIMGHTEMMVVCAQGTKSSALRLADLIEEKAEQKNLELKYIYLTHAHLDHSQGAGTLLERFPSARFVAHPGVAALQALRSESDDSRAKKRFGENAAVPSVPAEIWDQDHFLIDGNRIEVWSDLIGDAGVGKDDEIHTALYIPSLRALMPSDIVYFNGHVMMGGSTERSRDLWVKQLEDWVALELDVVVPGHMPKVDLDKLSARGALEHTIGYIKAYDRAMIKHDNSQAVIDEMLKLYPEVQHQSALYLGTYINFRETHKLLFNPRLEKIATALPDFFVRWLDRKMFEKVQRDSNIDFAED